MDLTILGITMTILGIILIFIEYKIDPKDIDKVETKILAISGGVLNLYIGLALLAQ